MGMNSEAAMLCEGKKEEEEALNSLKNVLLEITALGSGFSKFHLKCVKENKGLNNDYVLVNSEVATVNIIDLLTNICVL